MATTALTMIVKNEAHVIERCLNSVKGYVDFVLVHDTGSTDGTLELIQQWCQKHGVSHKVRSVLWEDFATNRSAVMSELAKNYPLIQYGMTIDADNVFTPSIGVDEFKAQLTTDIVEVEVNTNGFVHTVPQIYRNRKDNPYQYRGVLHEFVVIPPEDTRRVLTGAFMNQIQDSARNKNPDKYADDAAVLVKALETEQDPRMRARYFFYLGQSYRGCGEDNKAIEAYEERAAAGGWDQEVFYSYWNIGRLFLKAAEETEHEGSREHYEVMAVDSFLRAYQACPLRAESLHDLASYYRSKNQWNLAYLYASAGIGITPPKFPLFVRMATYDWALLDELALAAFYTGRKKEAETLTLQLLDNPHVPLPERNRIFRNLQLIRK